MASLITHITKMLIRQIIYMEKVVTLFVRQLANCEIEFENCSNKR